MDIGRFFSFILMLLVDCSGVVIDSSFNYMEIYFQRVNTEDAILSLVLNFLCK